MTASSLPHRTHQHAAAKAESTGSRRSRRLKVALAGVVVLMLSLVGSQVTQVVPAFANNVSFTGKGDAHSWTDARNWSTSAVPTSDDDVTIKATPAGPARVDRIPSSTRVHGLTLVGPGASVTGGSLVVTGSFAWSGGEVNNTLSVPVAGNVTIGTTPNSQPKLTGHLDLAGTTTLSPGTTLHLQPPATITNTGAFTAAPGTTIMGDSCCVSTARFDNRGSFMASVPPGSPIPAAAAVVSNMALDDSGTVSITGGGTLDLKGGGNTFASGATVNGPGRLLLEGSLNLAGDVNLASGAVFERAAGLSSAVLAGTGTFKGSGTFVWSGATITGSVTVASPVATTISGSATKALNSGGTAAATLILGGPTNLSGGTVNLGPPAVLTNTGTLTAAPGSSLFGGTIKNQATVVVSAAPSASAPPPVSIDSLVRNAGLIDLGRGGSTLVLKRGLTETATGRLRVMIEGPAGGNGFARFRVSGNATLAGSLAIATASSFRPTVGQTFGVMAYQSHSGSFSTVTGQALPNGHRYGVRYNPQGVDLVVA